MVFNGILKYESFVVPICEFPASVPFRGSPHENYLEYIGVYFGASI